MRPILESLKEFRALVVQLDNSPTGRLSKEMQTLKTTAVGALTEMERAFQGLPKALEKEIKAAGAAGKKAAKQAGKDVGEEMVDEAVMTVRSNRQKLQAEYEKAIASGRKYTGPELLGLRQAGVSLFPDDKTTLTGYSDASKGSSNVLASLRAQEQQIKKAADLNAAAAAAALRQEQADANRTYRFRNNFIKSLEKQEADRQALVGRASKGLIKLQSQLSEQALKEAQKDADRTFRFNTNWANAKAKEEAERANLVQRAGKGLAALRAKLADEDLAQQQKAAEKAFAFQRGVMKVQDDLAKAQRDSVAQRAKFQVLLATANAEGDYSRITGARAGTVVSLAGADQTNTQAQQMLAAAAAAARGQVARASAAPEGAFSVLGGANAGRYVSPESAEKMRQAQLGLTKAQENLNDAMRSGHSAARGLASGFNAMWLTWGQLGPLLAGAAVSNSFVQAIKQGAEFEQRLAAIRYLGGESAKSVGELAQAALQLSREGPVGPVEVATALKTLSLAGLNAREQLAAIKPTLNFAIAGELPLEKAAESLVAISSAFGYTAEGFGSVGDVISKAAAISMSSVESMTESFRQASTVAQQYGVTVEDAATSLALLSQVGIRGSAAGTAMRNMYNELMGTSKRARKVLEETLKVDVIDNGTKAMRPLLDIMQDMAGALSKMDFESQQKALQALGNERGLKALSANLMAFNQQAKEAGKDLPNRLAEIRKQLEDAPGFAAQAAIGMGLTTKNQIAGVFASLQAALVEAFGAISPVIQSTAAQLRSVFNSEGFRGAISSMISGVAQLTQFFVEHSKEVYAVAVGYVSAKVALVAMAAITPVAATGVAALNVAMASSAGVIGTVGLAIRGLLMSLGPIGALLAAVGTAWVLFSNRTKSAAGEATFAIDTHFSTTVEGLDKELDRLKKENKALEDNLAGKIADRSVESKMAEDRLRELHREEIAQKRVAHAALLAQAARAREAIEMRGGPGKDKTLAALDARVAASAADLGATVTRAYEKEKTLREKFAELKALADANFKLAGEVAKKNRPIPDGPDKFNPDDLSGSGRGGNPFRAQNKEFDNFLKSLKVAEDAAGMRAKDEESKAKLSLAQRLITAEEFENQRDQIALNHLNDRRALLELEVTMSERQQEQLRAAYEKARAADPKSVTAQDLDNELEGVANKIAESRQQLDQLKADQAIAVREAEIRKIKPLSSQLDEMDKFLKTQGDALQYDLERADAALKAASMTERGAAIEQARLATLIAFKREEAKLEREIALYKKNGGDDAATLKNAEDNLTKLRGQLPGAQDEAGKKAGTIFDKQTMAANVNDLKKSLAQGLMEAGQDGGKALVNTVRQQLINKPFQIFLEAVMAPVSGFLGGLGNSLAGSLLNTFGIRAGGGPVSRGNTYLMGENGPELVTMGDSGYVHNATQTERMRQAPSGGQSVVISVAPQINIDSRADQAQVASMVSRGMQESQKQMFDQLRAVGLVR